MPSNKRFLETLSSPFFNLSSYVWAFDAEWVPDPATGRRVYDLPDDMSDEEVVQRMYEKGGATEENPRPYLKPILCRVVSISVLKREVASNGSIALDLCSFPSDGKPAYEAELLRIFLREVGNAKPQLVGFNSGSADLPILIQRSLVNGVTAPKFCNRPEKPWEGVDYFAKTTDYHIDLREELGSFGKETPSLHQVATACGIPGKLGTTGGDVLELWQQGKVQDIVNYNECDALTTYLVWLRLAYLAGKISGQQYQDEQELLRTYLCSPGKGLHLMMYLAQWDGLRRKMLFNSSALI